LNSGSQPVVRGPPEVCSHLHGGPQGRPNINQILRKKYEKGKFYKFINFCSFQSLKNEFYCVVCVIDYKKSFRNFAG